MVATDLRVERRTIVLRSATPEMGERKERTYILGFGCDRLFPKDYGANVWNIKS